jgi:hypothetical protein
MGYYVRYYVGLEGGLGCWDLWAIMGGMSMA